MTVFQVAKKRIIVG